MRAGSPFSARRRERGLPQLSLRVRSRDQQPSRNGTRQPSPHGLPCRLRLMSVKQVGRMERRLSMKESGGPLCDWEGCGNDDPAQDSCRSSLALEPPESTDSSPGLAFLVQRDGCRLLVQQRRSWTKAHLQYQYLPQSGNRETLSTRIRDFKHLENTEMLAGVK